MSSHEERRWTEPVNGQKVQLDTEKSGGMIMVSSVSEKAGKESKEKGWESRLSERNRFLDVSPER